LRAANSFALAVGDDLENERVQRRIKLHAQALIEMKSFAEAVAVLRPLLKMSITRKEAQEAWGLMGRICKQSFVDRRAARHEVRYKLLEQAIEAYEKVWTANGNPYHGVNLLALRYRAYRDGGAAEEPKRLAVDIQDQAQTIIRQGGSDGWTHAILAEASIALKDFETATQAVKSFVADPNVKAFHVNSSLRQLREVWELDKEERAREILTTLEQAIQSRAIAAVGAEASPQPIALNIQYAALAEYSRSIVLIDTGDTVGTGFLAEIPVKSGGRRKMILTCEHVISGCQPSEVSVRFTAIEGGAASVLHIFPREVSRESDIAFLDIDRIPETATAVPLHRRTIQSGDAIQVLGHPDARSLEFNFLPSAVIEAKGGNFSFHGTLEPGSSGSPVFDKDWNLIGMYTGRRPGRGGQQRDQGLSKEVNDLIDKAMVLDLDDAKSCGQGAS
jgi:tetratricopeptide (TPR) repeat protein